LASTAGTSGLSSIQAGSLPGSISGSLVMQPGEIQAQPSNIIKAGGEVKVSTGAFGTGSQNPSIQAQPAPVAQAIILPGAAPASPTAGGGGGSGSGGSSGGSAKASAAGATPRKKGLARYWPWLLVAALVAAAVYYYSKKNK